MDVFHGVGHLHSSSLGVYFTCSTGPSRSTVFSYTLCDRSVCVCACVRACVRACFLCVRGDGVATVCLGICFTVVVN